MATEKIPYTIAPSNESSLVLEMFQGGLLRKKKRVLFFEEYSGEVNLDSEKPDNSDLRLTVKTASVVFRDREGKSSDRKQLIEAARNDLLGVSGHPQWTLVSQRLVTKGANHFELAGSLTLRGVTKPACVDLSIMRHGADRLELDGSFNVQLAEFGMKLPERWSGLFGGSQNVVFRLLLWADRKTVAATA